MWFVTCYEIPHIHSAILGNIAVLLVQDYAATVLHAPHANVVEAQYLAHPVSVHLVVQCILHVVHVDCRDVIVVLCRHLVIFRIDVLHAKNDLIGVADVC